MTQHLTPADRAYRALRDLAILDEPAVKEREAAIDEAIEQPDVHLTAGRARGDQLARQFAATEARVEELRRPLGG